MFCNPECPGESDNAFAIILKHFSVKATVLNRFSVHHNDEKVVLKQAFFYFSFKLDLQENKNAVQCLKL